MERSELVEAIINEINDQQKISGESPVLNMVINILKMKDHGDHIVMDPISLLISQIIQLEFMVNSETENDKSMKIIENE